MSRTFTGHHDDLMADRTVASAAVSYVHFTDHSAGRGMAIHRLVSGVGTGLRTYTCQFLQAGMFLSCSFSVNVRQTQSAISTPAQNLFRNILTV